jgi:uncharacterized membrane protein
MWLLRRDSFSCHISVGQWPDSLGIDELIHSILFSKRTHLPRLSMSEHCELSIELSAKQKLMGRAASSPLQAGALLFSLGVIALGIETWACAECVDRSVEPGYAIVPVLPWLPAVPWLAYALGTVWVVCGVGLVFPRLQRNAAIVLGAWLIGCTLIFDVPKNLANINSILLRTRVFEPLALGSLAWLLPAPFAAWRRLEQVGRVLLAVSLVVFGVDHFLALRFIATLVPRWIPGHIFWVVFFGLALIAGGLSLVFRLWSRYGAGYLGLMFGTWVLTLHLPRVLGFYGVPGAPQNPNEWSSLFIAVAFWGGLWASSKVSDRDDVGALDPDDTAEAS